jgi:hypothetical protein
VTATRPTMSRAPITGAASRIPKAVLRQQMRARLEQDGEATTPPPPPKNAPPQPNLALSAREMNGASPQAFVPISHGNGTKKIVPTAWEEDSVLKEKPKPKPAPIAVPSVDHPKATSAANDEIDIVYKKHQALSVISEIYSVLTPDRITGVKAADRVDLDSVEKQLSNKKGLLVKYQKEFRIKQGSEGEDLIFLMTQIEKEYSVMIRGMSRELRAYQSLLSTTNSHPASNSNAGDTSLALLLRKLDSTVRSISDTSNAEPSQPPPSVPVHSEELEALNSANDRLKKELITLKVSLGALQKEKTSWLRESNIWKQKEESWLSMEEESRRQIEKLQREKQSLLDERVALDEQVKREIEQLLEDNASELAQKVQLSQRLQRQLQAEVAKTPALTSTIQRIREERDMLRTRVHTLEKEVALARKEGSQAQLRLKEVLNERYLRQQAEDNVILQVEEVEQVPALEEPEVQRGKRPLEAMQKDAAQPVPPKVMAGGTPSMLKWQHKLDTLVTDAAYQRIESTKSPIPSKAPPLPVVTGMRTLQSALSASQRQEEDFSEFLRSRV